LEYLRSQGKITLPAGRNFENMRADDFVGQNPAISDPLVL